ncbi:MAG: zinc ribbon domain-containing protein [Pseudomonadales bacterium]|nr:zinc ribbon domain-containing protein [Pseudomonadales bacterium]
MPIFEYLCESCGHREELLQKSAARGARTCPQCDQPRLVRVLSSSSFQLRGTGWRKPAAQARASRPTRTVGHTLDSGAPHSHDHGQDTSGHSQRKSHGHSHDHPHGNDHKH